ncbi:hypothetical protein A3B18_01745 [Candidatus Giovannonibacteria bacterium RIFCSPLOWO2_01_FULL_46_13]|uniref:Uncharacterized protein n=1 Tax=Candidatus Giovannonibacteria bacterium RIFCSPLOWO2_01_FULL_46_13 TaxID=1798352 RepID=A0A1F5X5C9_9BACT|nr:MAG: hypothetical protein A3B18_01745 [Candidatus Giovannonibacteria bacterium RIFCSPLOWO2_01_FULL_46_13]
MEKDKNFTFDLSAKGLKIEIKDSFGSLKLELPPDIARPYLAGTDILRERTVREQFIDPLTIMLKILCAISEMSVAYPDGAYAVYPMMRTLLHGLSNACVNLMDAGERKKKIPQNPRGNA